VRAWILDGVRRVARARVRERVRAGVRWGQEYTYEMA